MKEEHKQVRKQSRQLTKEARKDKEIKIYKLKVDRSHLSKQRYQHLKMLFVEAKWIYNYMLANECIFDYDYKNKEIQVKNKDGNIEDRKLQYLSAQMRQAYVDKVRKNIYNLSKAKKKGRKVGKLKFKSEVNCTPLKQYGATYRIVSKNRVKIQGIKIPIRVRGIQQLGDYENADIANAQLIKVIDDFYIHVTVYEEPKEHIETGKRVGLDLGIKDSVVTSDGVKYGVKIPESNALKRRQRELAKKQKGSRNRFKAKKKLNKEYNRIKNQKNDKANKIINSLSTEYDFIAFQDENIKAWHSGLFGKSVQISVLGRIKSGLKRKPETAYMVDQLFPSTKLCPKCGKVKEGITLADRIFWCECGYIEDRDTKAAKTILLEALDKTGMERISSKLVESVLATSKNVSTVKQEANVL